MVLRGTALAACVMGSIGLHLGVLLPESTATALAPSSAVGGRPPDRSAGVTVRLQTAARADDTAARTTDTAPQPARAIPVTIPVTTTDWSTDTLAPPSAGPDATPGAVDAEYLPRSQLTRGPAPQHPIDLFYPDLAPSGHFRAVVTLFIDDRGVVQRVRIDEADDSGLPHVLEDATRQTFLRSAFAPGEIDGHPTRSRLRIEVEYSTASR
jgi:hypothetical protein